MTLRGTEENPRIGENGMALSEELITTRYSNQNNFVYWIKSRLPIFPSRRHQFRPPSLSERRLALERISGLTRRTIRCKSFTLFSGDYCSGRPRGSTERD